jgi:hypothetical protein
MPVFKCFKDCYVKGRLYKAGEKVSAAVPPCSHFVSAEPAVPAAAEPPAKEVKAKA